MAKKVLVLSYFFPPVGGAGVQRVTKFVKYLPAEGWQPLVLTVSNPSVPLFDDTLLQDIPDSVAVYKAKTFEPDYRAKKAVSAASDSSSKRFNPVSLTKNLIRKVASMVLQPDPQVLWLPSAWNKACAIIELEKPVVIFASAPPFSSLLLGARLARKFKIPLVLDYRDEWDISNSVWENKRIGPLSSRLQQGMQKYALRSASAVVATTSMSCKALSGKLKTLESSARVECIYNGFDASDFLQLSIQDKKPGEKFTLSYVGTLWNLTSIAPLVSALQQLSAELPDLARQLRLLVAGRRTDEQQKYLDRLLDTPICLETHDYLEHGSAIEQMANSDCLALLLSDYDFARRVVPAKIFEYFASKRSILAIAPEGEVWDLLQDYPAVHCAEPADVQSIAAFLKEALRRHVTDGSMPNVNFDASPFDRSNLSTQLADLFDVVST